MRVSWRDGVFVSRAGLRRPTASKAKMAKPATKAKRVEISVSDTQLDKVLASRVVAPSLRAQSMAIPLATVAFLLIGIVLGAMLWPIQRFETAPGTAELVGDLLFIADDEVAIYTPKTGVRFVTAMGSELTALQSFMGWVDPVVNVLTCEERFGDCDPAASRELQLGAMANAKEIAAYVALSYLGFDATFTEGPAQVAGFDPTLCPTDSPKKRACKVLQVGDVIESIDLGDGPIVIDVVSKLTTALAKAAPGDIATLTILSLTSDGGTKSHDVDVELVASPDDETRTLIGFTARDTRTVDLPFAVDFDTAAIGGPSAGLSFALALIDNLTEGEMTPPQGVAVTGTIQEDGTVGPIGALVQKAIAVKKSGAKIFLVPTGQGVEEIAAAQAAVGSTVEIVPVGTLAEALAALLKRGGQPVVAPTR
jgi:Lon-like protease